MKGLNIVGRSVGVRTTLPVLSNILLKTEKGGLKLSATDLEVGITTWIGAKVDQEGAITVPAKLLVEYINSNRDKTINLDLKEISLNLSSEHYKADIKGIDAQEFPLIPTVKKASAIEIRGDVFARAIDKVLIAVASDESRPVLAGIYLTAKDNTLKIVATDSYRLAEQKITLEKKIEGEVNLIIPQRPMAEVARILRDGVEHVVIYPGENQVEFVLGETTLVSRLIEGVFPDYTQIIPKAPKITMTAKSPEFNNAIKMASLFARESANNIKVKLSEPDKIEIIAISPHLGGNTSRVTGSVKGGVIEIAFNAKFVLDVIAILGGDAINLSLTDNVTAGMVTSPQDKDYLYIIMPLRVDE